MSQSARKELETKGYECDFETFAGLYERSEPLASSPDDEDEADDGQGHPLSVDPRVPGGSKNSPVPCF